MQLDRGNERRRRPDGAVVGGNSPLRISHEHHVIAASDAIAYLGMLANLVPQIVANAIWSKAPP